MCEDVLKLYLSTIPTFSPLAARKERQLALRSANGDQTARKQLAALHLRLVVEIAHRYAGRGLTPLDLVQEGNLGLMKAVEHYKPRNGRRFADYAKWWIKREIGRALRGLSDRILRNVCHEFLQNAGKMDEQSYLAEIAKIPQLTPADEVELARDCAFGDLHSRRELTYRSLHRVVAISKEYLGRGLSLMDMIQAGNTALKWAAEHFSLDKGETFSAFAECCIRQRLKHALLNKGSIKVDWETGDDYRFS